MGAIAQRQDVFVSPALISFLESHPLSNERPIRVIGSMESGNPTAAIELAWDEFVDWYDGAWTREQCAATGLTISTYGLISQAPADYRDVALPTATWWPAQEANSDNYYIYDCMWLPVEQHNSECLHFDAEWDGTTFVLVEAMPGLISTAIPCGAIDYADDFRWSELLEPALAAQLDPEAYERYRAEFVQRQRHEFAQFLRERSNSEVNRIRSEIERLTRDLTVNLNAARSAETQLRNHQQLLDAATVLASDGGPSDEDLLVELDALERHADIRSVNLNLANSTLGVATGPIELTHPDTGRSVIVGEYDLTFNFLTGEITGFNRTNRHGALDHPHIRDRSFCLGEMTNTVSRLMQQRQVGAAVNLVIASLKTVNPQDDWGRAVNRWFDSEYDDEGEFIDTLVDE